MLKTVEGVYRHGRIELTEEPSDVREETRVLVTFLEANLVDLRARGIDEAQAAELRARLATFAEDWNSPEMSTTMTTMPPKPAHRRGDVVLVLFPHSDLRTAKLRPALVVQADNLQTGSPGDRRDDHESVVSGQSSQSCHRSSCLTGRPTNGPTHRLRGHD